MPLLRSQRSRALPPREWQAGSPPYRCRTDGRRDTDADDRRMHWAQWLRMWGRFVRSEVVGQPEMAALFASGRVKDDGLVEIKQAITALGPRRF